MRLDQALLEKYIYNHPGEVIRAVESLDLEDLTVVINSLPDELSVLLFSEMDRFKAARCLEKIDREKSIPIIDALTPSIAISILRHMDGALINSILEKLPVKKIRKCTIYDMTIPA